MVVGFQRGQHAELPRVLTAVEQRERVPVLTQGVAQGGPGAAAGPQLLHDGPPQSGQLEGGGGQPPHPRPHHLQGPHEYAFVGGGGRG